MIKEIENLEKFYEAKILAVSSKDVSSTLSVHFGSKPTQPNQKKPWHPKYVYGQMASDSSSISDGSKYPGRDYMPDTHPTPKADIPNSTAEDDMKSRWVPPNSVHGNDDYPSSVLNKGGYL